MIQVLTQAWPVSTALLRDSFEPGNVVVIWDDGAAGLMENRVARAECERVGADPAILRHLHRNNPEDLVVILQSCTLGLSAFTVKKPGGDALPDDDGGKS